MSNEKPARRVWRVAFSGDVYVTAECRTDAIYEAWVKLENCPKDVVEMDDCIEDSP